MWGLSRLDKTLVLPFPQRPGLRKRPPFLPYLNTWAKNWFKISGGCSSWPYFLRVKPVVNRAIIF
jgi:hypothetical protein